MSIQAQNQYLDYLIDPSFQGLNKVFVLSFENNAHWTSYKGYFLVTVTIKDFNDGKNIFDQPVKNDRITWWYGMSTALCLFQKLLKDESNRFR